MEDYREYREQCIANGERIQYVYEEHCREAILEQLIEMSKIAGVSDMHIMQEEADTSEMLWVLLKDEVIEKGIYSINRPDTELLIYAPPALMALLIGEYGLARKLCDLEMRDCREDIAIEVLQDNRGPLLHGGKYRFCEACLLSSDMLLEETLYFDQKGFFDDSAYYTSENSFLKNVYLHGEGKQAWKYIYKAIQRVTIQKNECETLECYMVLFTWYALLKQMDTDNDDFWKDLYGLFSEVEQWNKLTGIIHGLLFRYYGPKNDIETMVCKLIPCVEEHFRHVDYLCMDGYVEEYMEYIIGDNKKVESLKNKKYTIRYFGAIKQFRGEYTKEWRELVFKLFNKRDLELLELAFQNHILKKECITEYIEYFITQKEYSWILAYLIQKNWLIKEKANGNI